MRLLRNTFLLFFAITSCGLRAQSEQCGAHQILASQYSPEEIKTLHQKNTENLKNWQLENQNFIKNRSVVTLPVVVHVVWHEEEENISDDQIYSQIDILNKDFRAMNCQVPTVEDPFKSLVADMEVEFCLAQIAPDGSPTTGITRTRSPIPFFDCNSDFLYKESLGGADAWDTDRYINIWVAKLGPVVGGSTLGCGTFTYSRDSARQGITINYWAFGNVGPVIKPNHLGRTATHEMGHFFNLQHVFSNGNEPEPCADDPDGIPDTPTQNRTYAQRCPNETQFSCGTQDMYMNYMNYTADGCMAMFTKGQKAVVWATLNVLRPELLQSNVCIATPQTDDFEYTIAPNPVSDFFTLKKGATTTHRSGTLRILDTSGKVVFELWDARVNSPISIQDLQSGFYFVEFSCGNLRSISKLVKI